MELLRPLVSANNIFLKFFIFEVLQKLLKNFTSLRVCSSLYAYAVHTRQELMPRLSICARQYKFHRWFYAQEAHKGGFRAHTMGGGGAGE